MSAPAPALQAFAREVGPADPVLCVGGRTRWDVGGAPDPTARVVAAPAGVVQVLPAEMVVRVRAGTPVVELAEALQAVGQECALPMAPGSTVGGTVAVGRGGVDQLGLGPVRDAVLELTWVTADGEIARNGAAVVKNVSGFDLCRLLVGSLGTLGLLAEVVLRTRPLPAQRCWLAGDADPDRVVSALHAPRSVLWDGTTTWAQVEGGPEDVDEQRRRAAAVGLAPVDGPPALPPHRWSTDRTTLRSSAAAAGPFVALVGVGVVFSERPGPAPRLGRLAAGLNRRVKARFDPSERFNPGRDVLEGVELVDDEELMP